MSKLPLLLALGGLLAARDARAADGFVRDVRPTTLGPGETLIVECPGVAVGMPHTVRIEGRGDGDARVSIEVEGLAASGDRVLVAPAAALARKLPGGRLHHARILVAARDGERWTTTAATLSTLDVTPSGARGLAARAAGFAPRMPSWALELAVLAGLALVLHLLVAPLTGVLSVWERKVAGRMQSRLGPNRTGPQGWLQWLADALKLLTKEDLVPREADARLFRLSPYLVWMSIFATFVVLPVSESAIIADLDVGVLYLVSVTSLVVIGILMGGWASASKWSLLGGMRSAAQIVSYELPAALALLQPVLLAGSLAPQAIVRAQGGMPHTWFVFANPFAFLAFFIYFIAALAEGNRTPFDLPEAESELVSGYSTEYSGFRFSIYFLGEWTNLYVVGAIAATVFLGGWNVPFVSPEQIAVSWPLRVVSIGVMLAKVIVLVFIIIWIRWTLPRLRLDQMMTLCWKYLVPFALAAFLGTAGWMIVANAVPVLDAVMRWLVFAFGGLAVAALFVARVLANWRSTRLLHAGDRQFAWPFGDPPGSRKP